MLNKLTILSLLFGLLLFGSCKSGYSPEVQKLYDEVMVIHDEVMPEMGTIHQLKKQLKKALPNAQGDIDKQVINDNIRMLDFADDSMMDWMHQFKVPEEGSEEQKLNYLMDQKEKMGLVSKDMKSIIKKAQDAVNNYK